MLPVDRFLQFIRQNQLFEPSDKILLAVSGGRDSVLMAHLFNEATFNFGIAHCNFGLREQESDADQAFVEELAGSFNTPFFYTHFETEAFVAENQVSIQMAARELRYQWFEEIRETQGYTFIAVAHHQSDATETVLLNLVRGTGIAGLHGILPKRDNIIRPLLFLSGTEIRELVLSHRLSYREDSSNLSTKYARNKIRHKVVPVLKELNPGLDLTFTENSRRFAEMEEFLTKETDALRKRLFIKDKASGDNYIPLDELKSLSPLHLLLFELFKPFNFSEPVINDLVQSWEGQAGKLFESDSHSLLLDRHQLILKKKAGRNEQEIHISQGDQPVSWQGHTFTGHYADPADLCIKADSKIAYFDAGLLQFPLKLRLWKRGDYFYPFGMKGKKKLSDFFTGLKLPLFKKDEIPVVENGNGDILWVAGYRSDNRYKVTPRTKKVFILEDQNKDEQ